MAKYQVTAKISVFFTFDTADYEDDFAQTKDELVDKLDPEDPDVIHDFVADMDPGDIIGEFGSDGLSEIKAVKK